MSIAQNDPPVLTNVNLNWEYIDASFFERDRFYPYMELLHLPAQVRTDFYNMYDANPNLDRRVAE